MIQEKIIEILKNKDGYISGEEISSRLKVSRQALWKHIHQLKASGYEITAIPHLGYQLIALPDRLFVSEIQRNLDTKFIGKKIYYFDSLASTMDLALERGIKGDPEGTLVIAESQTKGRGRLGRDWLSPKYKGIYLSLILRPQITIIQSPVLTLLISVSICEAIKEQLELDAKIKWPNDIMLQNKKLGGILTELNAEMDRVHFVVMGFGLNVNNDKDALLPAAISLKEVTKENIHRPKLLQEILRKIEINYLLFQKKSAPVIIDKWRQFNLTLDKRVKVTCQKLHLEGQAVDIDTDGGLLIRNDLGLVQKIMAGDVTSCR